MTAKKIMRITAILSAVLSIVLFLALSIQFDSDPLLFSMLENKDVISTLNRMMVYVIPGTCFIGSCFAFVFSTKKILIFMALIQIGSAVLLRNYTGVSVFMYALYIIYLVLSLLYLLGAVMYKTEIRKA
ncbi:MAG: hypothetical protein Q4D13_07440 [Erysipelotrichaceae bacterium]|nr:hypothetical protein [Erysipelotrichaceae bacterium]